MDDTLSLEDSRELLALCKAGRLYQVEEWIRAGKSLRVHAKSRDEPLHATLRTGFLSLIELLARHTDSQDLKNDVLLQAVRRQMPEIAMMLVEQGADASSVPFSDVICAWDPAMMRYFMAKGCDPFKEDDFARALSYGIRTALGFYMDCKRDHPEQADNLQYQLDMALVLHCREGNEKWVAMLMWAGGDPHAKVRDLECKKDQDKPWHQISGAEEAARKGHVKVLEFLDLEGSHPDAQSILYKACGGIHDRILHPQFSRVRPVLRRKCALAHGRVTGNRRKGMRSPPRRRRFNYAGDAAGLIEKGRTGAKKTGQRDRTRRNWDAHEERRIGCRRTAGDYRNGGADAAQGGG